MINIDVLQSAHPRHLGPIRDCRFMDEERTRIALVNYTVEATFGRGTISPCTAKHKEKPFVYLVLEDNCKDTFVYKNIDDDTTEIKREIRLKFPKTLEDIKSINMCIEDLKSLKIGIIEEMKVCIEGQEKEKEKEVNKKNND